MIGYICHPYSDPMTAMLNTKFMFGAAALLFAGLLNAQGPAVDPVLMTVDGAPVLRSEFEAIYKKNNKDASVTRQALDEYMELFTNY
jgi:peptidyl-prolyl cis-trans isomerase SurA